MKTENFDSLIFEPLHDGVRSRKNYPNGYGASVVKHGFSCGNEEGFYELAVLKNNRLTYDTPITEDVIGGLTPEGVDELLIKIKDLSPIIETAAHKPKTNDEP